jgi:hypothetical protein
MVTESRQLSDRARGDEGGAIAIIVALTLTGLLMAAALVLDIAGLRADSLRSKSVADMAAAAAVVDYDPAIPNAALDACIDAVDFTRSNLGNPPVAAIQSCAAIYSGYSCDPNVEPSPPATYDIGDRRVEIVIPVPDGHPLLEQMAHGVEFDGQPCDRVGVRITRDRDYLFARVGGFNSGTTTRSSVGRNTILGEEKDWASLIVLQRNGCQTLSNTGGGQFRVFNLERWEDADGNPVPVGTPGAQLQTYPGTITTDTLPAGCSGNQKIIEGSNNSLTEAQGKIYAHSLVSADPTNASTYNTNHVNLSNGQGIVPEPSPGPLITRSLLDHAYNCQPSGYGSATPLWSPLRGNQPIDPCEPVDALGNPVPPPPPYLANLDSAVQSVMNSFTSGTVPAGWGVLTTAECGASGYTVTGGRWIVDCPNSLGPRGLTFQDAEHIIFRNGVSLGTNADVLNVYGSPGGTGTTVTMWDNGLEMSGGSLEFRNVFTYIRSAATNGTNGRLDVSGSVNRFAVQAPLESEVNVGACSSYSGGLPPASCFTPVALWSNFVGTGGGNSLNAVSGNAAGGIIGTIFTPNSLFRFRGSGDLLAQNCGAPSWDLISNTSATLELVGAQFFASRIDVAGTAQIGMCPSPETSIGIPIRGSALIR